MYKIVEGLARGDAKITRDYHEYVAISTLEENGIFADLPWHSRRHGREGDNEPDWVILDDNGKIIAGFEVTEIVCRATRDRNEKLRRIKRGRTYSISKGAKKQVVEAYNDALKAYDVASRFGKDAIDMQKLLTVVSNDWVKNAIGERIKAKMKKQYHYQNEYPVHLIIYESDYLIFDEDRESVLNKKALYDKGNFTSIWYVDYDHALIKLAD